MENDPWYKNGLKFKCTGCGKCCTGSPGYVWISLEEGEKIASFLQISYIDFRKRYTRQIGDRVALIEFRKNHDCVFLQDGKFCRIYSVRPRQCQTYPWWPEILSHEKNWEEEKDRCEGIDHPDGVHTSFKEISGLLNLPQTDKKKSD
ncbi:MAG: YkgJ family cysteine cluster protein [Rhabdochlamydiaceae bacterium]